MVLNTYRAGLGYFTVAPGDYLRDTQLIMTFARKAKMISHAKEMGLPVEKLMDNTEMEREPREWIFVVRRNKVAHGDVHGYPHPQGRIIFKTPRVIHQMDWFGSVVNASDAYDQLDKSLCFLIAWRKRTISR